MVSSKKLILTCDSEEVIVFVVLLKKMNFFLFLTAITLITLIALIALII